VWRTAPAGRPLASNTDGTRILTRFGRSLAQSFDPAEPAPPISEALRQGLALEWAARVLLRLSAGEALRAQPTGAAAIALDADAEPVPSIPLVRGAERVGAIECGHKREAP
jgi:hypothetical protein